MTSSTTEVQAASNGTETTDKQAPAEREHGLSRLREEECYYLSALVERCLSEAEFLVRKVNSKAFSRTIDQDGSKGTQPLDRVQARKTLDEAYDCASLALTYLFSASTRIGNDDYEVVPVF